MKLHIADSALELHFTFPKWHGLNKWFDHLVTDLYTGKKKKKEKKRNVNYANLQYLLHNPQIQSFEKFSLIFIVVQVNLIAVFLKSFFLMNGGKTKYFYHFFRFHM